MLNGSIRTIAQFGDNEILIGTERNGLYLFDGDKITPFQTDGDSFMRANQLYSMAVSDRAIAVGTVLNGLIIIDIKTRKCTYLNTETGLQNNTILSLCFDDCNNLWLGLDNGIDYVITESPIMELYGKLNSYGSGYGSLIYDEKLYLATNQGLFYISYPMQSSERRTAATLINGSQGQVWNINTLGKTLICCHNRGLFAVSDNRLETISEEDGFWQARELQNKNFAIAGAYSGLYLLEKQGSRWKIKNKVRGYKDVARIFEIDGKNRVVILSSKGVERLTLNKTLDSITSEIICRADNSSDYFNLNKIDNSLTISNNNICLKTNEKDDFINGADFFNLLEGIRQYSIIKKDADNNIWYITDNTLKVLVWNKKKKSYTSKPIQIWNIHGYFIGGFASLTPVGNNSVIAGCVSGFALGNLNNVHSAPENRELFIRAVYTTNIRDSLIYGENFPKIPQKVKIPYKNNSIRISFGGSTGANDNQEYRYYLLPTDNNFGDWGNSNIKEYTSLHEGKYRFIVEMRSNNSDVVKRTEFMFEISPPSYRTWWAYTIYALLIYTCIYWILRYIKIKIYRNKLREERKKEAAIKEQEQKFLLEQHEKEKEVLELKNENIKFQLKNKSQELANILLNHLNKKEILVDLKTDLKKIQSDLQGKNIEKGMQKVIVLQGKISSNIEKEIDWSRFEDNFDIVNDFFLKRLLEKFPWLNKNERRLCIYIKMGLLTKEIAPLMNLSIRGVEMMRYRMRKKMGLDKNEDLEMYFQTFNSVYNIKI
jgi:DNA-binding CsgD family transcriptional regulator